MPHATINLIVIHCAATPNGVVRARYGKTAAERIDYSHGKRGFRRRDGGYAGWFNPHLKHIGYHYVIDTDGALEQGRAIGEQGAHVRGHNKHSLGICLIGTDAFTHSQWQALHHLLKHLSKNFPDAVVCGHRDLSPDLNGDGTIEPNEWIKICPGFNVSEWLDNGLNPLPEHSCEVIYHGQ